MSAPIQKVCVIGAGVMGAGIAAQVANAGVPVLLLDIAKEGEDRSAIARGAVARMLKTEPAPFMSRDAAKLVEVGNLDDDLEKAAECQWVVEAVIERLDIKQALYARLDKVCGPATAISSNTSTIRLASLLDGASEQFRRRFAITHFFNPPRYMRLLELVTGPNTDTAMFDGVVDFIDRRMGKTVVVTHDTPGFIANRIGTYWLQHGVNQAVEQGLTVSEADAVMGRPLGIPKTGIFGLLDLIGLDLMPHIARSMTEALPREDAFHATVREQAFIRKMIADGYTGRKGKGGFYRINKGESGREKIRESIGLVTGVYEPAQTARLPDALGRDPAALMFSDSRYGQYAWRVMGDTLAYAASLVPEIADDVVSVDAAMRLGFNWKQGPFELLDAIGPARVAARLQEEGRPVPALLRAVGDGTFYRIENGARQFFGTDGAYHDIPERDGVLSLDDIKRRTKRLAGNKQASLWDIGEGVACLEFHSKMNALDDKILAVVKESVEIVGRDFRALVISNDATNFSAGANLGTVLFAANIAAWGEIEKTVAEGQRVFKAMKYAPFPVVAAPAGLALGGGCEVLLHADSIVAHAETYAGLVETGVGLVPGWGGCGEMMERLSRLPGVPKGPMPVVASVFETISQAKVSKSAAEARQMGILRPTDSITMNRDRLLFDARAKALALVDGYAPPTKPEFRLAGAGGRTGLGLAVHDFAKRGIATPHDVVVAGTLAELLTGGEADAIDVVSEEDMLALERRAFMRLIRTGPTLQRIEHTLVTGKPLRN
ncbi:3-hydroxyacyl-CoA dehydrogenase NAD-binding domain-containing protein [Acetobacteraceae bacterium KSS8]|uniref:3-hydroxyacyl-CoA dehydrogenase NAD-binding domain-containing protein n=1 Tax=Endosaccharibacter trunci TaxID=2812733 RepID=A0ABT1WAA1_9PROT|nr:3-hydroxyacyl-CoA dehydrogenase NAD-binding domain-containing protein [Acetobacteraceae bacterium KSS8]